MMNPKMDPYRRFVRGDVLRCRGGGGRRVRGGGGTRRTTGGTLTLGTTMTLAGGRRGIKTGWRTIGLTIGVWEMIFPIESQHWIPWKVAPGIHRPKVSYRPGI